MKRELSQTTAKSSFRYAVLSSAGILRIVDQSSRTPRVVVANLYSRYQKGCSSVAMKGFGKPRKQDRSHPLVDEMSGFTCAQSTLDTLPARHYCSVGELR